MMRFSTAYVIAVEDTKKMKDWFEKRTKLHIDLVKKYCNKIHEYDPERFKGLIDRGEEHDQSKYKEPEYTPYLYISWQYKCKDDGVDFVVPQDIKDRMNAATEHHVHSNRHHPEYFSTEKETINREDRDKPPKKLIDATQMTDLDIGEMIADWLAMSEEKGTNPKDWVDKNVNKRWKFSDDQVKLIYELVENVWEKQK